MFHTTNQIDNVIMIMFPLRPFEASIYIGDFPAMSGNRILSEFRASMIWSHTYFWENLEPTLEHTITFQERSQFGGPSSKPDIETAEACVHFPERTGQFRSIQLQELRVQVSNTVDVLLWKARTAAMGSTNVGHPRRSHGCWEDHRTS